MPTPTTLVDTPYITLGNTPVVPAAVSAVNQVFPVDTGWPGKLNGYVPKKYSKKLLRKFYDECVVAAISNTDYEGEIRDYGDTVIIRKRPDIQVSAYTKGKDLEYKTYDTDFITLTIDRGYYYAFATNPVDDKQTDIKNYASEWTDDASKQLAISIDVDILASLAGASDADNRGTAAGRKSHAFNLGTTAVPVVVTKDNAADLITDAGTVLAEQNLPVGSEQGSFWAVVPYWYRNRLAKGDLRRADVMGDGKSRILRGTQATKIELDAFTVYCSNLLPTFHQDAGEGTEEINADYVFFGHKDALTFATQLTQDEVITNPRTFGLLHRGLQIFGFKVVQTKMLGEMVVSHS